MSFYHASDRLNPCIRNLHFTAVAAGVTRVSAVKRCWLRFRKPAGRGETRAGLRHGAPLPEILRRRRRDAALRPGGRAAEARAARREPAHPEAGGLARRAPARPQPAWRG